MMRDADDGIFLARVDHLISPPMSSPTVAQNFQGKEQRTFARRPFPKHITIIRQNHGFIDRNPVTHLVVISVADLLCVTGEPLRRPGVKPTAFLREPQWIGKMMQGDKRCYIFADKRINDLVVMTDGIFIKGAFARLDAAPFYREAVGVVGKFLGEAEILIEQFVVTYRRAGSLPVPLRGTRSGTYPAGRQGE